MHHITVQYTYIHRYIPTIRRLINTTQVCFSGKINYIYVKTFLPVYFRFSVKLNMKQNVRTIKTLFDVNVIHASTVCYSS
jgi:hypothetical protein